MQPFTGVAEDTSAPLVHPVNQGEEGAPLETKASHSTLHVSPQEQCCGPPKRLPKGPPLASPLTRDDQAPCSWPYEGSMPSGLPITSLHKTEGEASFLTGHLWTPNPGWRPRRESSNHIVIKRRCAKAHTGVHRYSAWQSRGCTLEQDRPPAFLPPAPPTPSRSPVSVLQLTTVYFGGVTALT